jgi:hypothetical protein
MLLLQEDLISLYEKFSPKIDHVKVVYFEIWSISMWSYHYLHILVLSFDVFMDSW